jgi:predicted HAD superfamily Cof-like phosphohydrolase
MSSFKAQEIVREFTLGAANAVYPKLADGSFRPPTVYPDRPVLAHPDKVKFISKMVMSELLEMLLTIEPETSGVKQIMHEIVEDLDLPSSKIPCMVAPASTAANLKEAEKVKEVNKETKSANNEIESEIIEAQMDAVVDIMYYILDFCTKQGYNIDRILDLVHEANMNKRHEDKLFHKREDGKVIKPKDWKEADLQTEVLRQIKNGSWTS